MARYLMGDTRLGWLERMMTDPSRTPPARAAPRKNRPQEKPSRGQPAKSWAYEKEGGV